MKGEIKSSISTKFEGKGEIKLSTPIKVDGKEIKELSYDTDKIDALAFCEACKKASTGHFSMSLIEGDASNHLYIGMAAIIAENPSLDFSDLERLKGADMIKAMCVGRNFITRSLKECSDQNSSEKQSEDTPEYTTQALEK